MKKRVVSRTAEFWCDENEILWSKPFANAEIDLDDCVDNILILKNLCAEPPCLKIVDSRNSWKITKEAQEYAQKADTPQRTLARAIIVSSVTDAVLKNFFLRFNKPEIPVKIFTSEAAAVKWLLAFKK